MQLFKQLGISIALLIVGFLSIAQADDNAVVSYTDRGHVIHRTRRPSGGVTDYLPHAGDEILIRFKDTATSAAKSLAHSRHQSTTIKRFRHVRNLELVKLPSGLSFEQALKTYRDNENVLYAEPNYLIEALVVPNDPSFTSQWNLRNTGQNGGMPGADINAVQAWDITTGSNNVVVAVIDTGVDYTHQDLAANMWRNEADCNSNGVDDDHNGYTNDCYGIDTFNNDSNPLDDNNHGTHVAGIIGAVGNNSLGVVGVNWTVKIMACKFLDASGVGTVADAIECLQYVQMMKDRGVNIVATNNSWGAYVYSQALYDAIDAQRQSGILFIAAAGNSSGNNDPTPFYPASYNLPNIISVAATDRSDHLASFSDYGNTTVHLGAPGVEILSTIRGNNYSTMSGTSMATPHVTGLAALLKAQDPNRDWRAIKNLILAGGDTRSSLNNTITQKRLNALGSLTCSNSSVAARLLPTATTIVTNTDNIDPIALAALHIRCASPNGDVGIVVNPGGQVVTLRDDGLETDQSAGDGIYSGIWTPPGPGTFTLNFPDGDIVTVQVVVDPDLKPGFPVKTFHDAGGYQGGPGIHTLVGNIDGDSKLEIIASALALGPLYAWKADGSPVPGWPLADHFGAAYPALGELSLSSQGLAVFAGHFANQAKLTAYSGAGAHLPGWPRNSANYTATPATLADVDGDGVDEIFVEEEDGLLHAYRADGSLLSGWPNISSALGQERHTPAIADLDGDGRLEIVTASERVCGATCRVSLFAYHDDGTVVNGFPVSFNGSVHTFPVIGDVDGDGQPEIVVVGGVPTPAVLIFSASGTLKRTIPITGSISYGTAPALADLDGDGIPEIIVQTDQALNVFRGNGTTFPGWPVIWGDGYGLGNSAPVVGDVDSDGFPDIVITIQVDSGTKGEVRVYNRNGILHPHFPKTLKIGAGAVPAIADIDLDGRNEIIITGDYWNGVPGDYDKVWVYDLGGPPSGPIQWGQFMGGPKHQGAYSPVSSSITRILTVGSSNPNAGVNITIAPNDKSGANSGNTPFTRNYNNNTLVTLTAPATAGVNNFQKWQRDGTDWSSSLSTQVTMDGNHALTAVYVAPIRTLTISSGSPASGASITVSPNDNNGLGNGTTQFTRLYNNNTAVTLTAPPIAGGNKFNSWNGCDSTSGVVCNVTMSANKNVTAFYIQSVFLSFGGTYQDRVGQGEFALTPDGSFDGGFGMTMNLGSGSRTITRLQLMNSAGRIWNTQGGDGLWTLGAATSSNAPSLLNAPDDSVNFLAVEGRTYSLYAADFQNQMFLVGTKFTLTVEFADGSVTVAETTIPADTFAPINLGVTAPTNNQTVSGVVTLKGTAEDFYGIIQKIEFYIDSDANPVCVDSTPKLSGAIFQCNWDSASKPNGAHTVKAKAYDPNNNSTGFSTSVVFTVNNSPAPSISLNFDGQLRDKVGQNEFALVPDGQLDGVFTVTLNAGSGNRTVTRLHLTNSRGGIWNTQGGDGYWSLGAATGLDTSLLNAANDAVNFVVIEGNTFKIFAADYLGQMFVPGVVFSLTANFADGSVASASVGITTLPTVTLVATSPNATEGGASGAFTITRTGAVTAPLAVNYVVSGTALNGTDYAALTGNIVIPIGSSTAIITVAPIDDGIVESNETVVLTLSPDPAYTVGSPATTTVTIADNDSPVTCAPGIVLTYDGQLRDKVGQGEFALTGDGLADGVFSVTFTGTGTNCVVTRLDFNRTGPIGIWDTIPNNQFWVLGAGSGLDTGLLNASDGSVNFAVSTGTSFKIFAADYISAPAGFPAGLFIANSNFTLNTTFAGGGSASASATILPSVPVVTISATSPLAAEGGQSGAFTISRTGSTVSALTVNYTVGGTATGGSDYPSLPGSVIIPANSSSAVITVTATDDSIIEAPETIVLTLSAGVGYTVGVPGTATVTIGDNDFPACNPSIALSYDGALRDKVGQGEVALTPDGKADGVFNVAFSGTGSCTVTRLELNRTGPIGIWDTVIDNQFWILGASSGLDTGLVNASDGSVYFPVDPGSSLKIFAADFVSAAAGFPNGLFIPGSNFTLKASFLNGSTATTNATINSTSGGPTISLSYDGKIRDKVGQNELALNPDGQLDGVFSATLNAGSGNRVVTRLQLNRSGAIGVWDTQVGDGYWSLGVAGGLDTALLNAANDSVNFQLTEGNTFKLFASDYQGQLFVPGSSFTLNVNFSDGTTATQSVTIP